MKFIHTSDWHIGRQFHNVSLLEDQRHVLNQLIEYIKNESVDALVIAGDIYDRSIPPSDAVALLDEVLNTICLEMNVPVILISGNHDSADRLRFGARQLTALATDRVYRIGQTKNVNVYIPMALHPEMASFDLQLNSLLGNKIDLSDAVVSNTQVEADDLMGCFG